jgi:hypothetical protein
MQFYWLSMAKNSQTEINACEENEGCSPRRIALGINLGKWQQGYSARAHMRYFIFTCHER